MKGCKILAFSLVSVASLIAVEPLFAAMAIPYGWYLEGNLGKSRATNKTYGSNTSVSGTGFGWNVNFGYKFTSYFAGELGYTNYAKTIVKSNGVQAAKDTHYSFDLAGKGILPIGDSGADFFAKLGLAYSHSNTSITNSTAASGLGISTGANTSTGVYYGLGAEYAVSSNLNINIQWNRAKGNNNVGNLDLYSVGLGWIFS